MAETRGPPDAASGAACLRNPRRAYWRQPRPSYDAPGCVFGTRYCAERIALAASAREATRVPPETVHPRIAMGECECPSRSTRRRTRAAPSQITEIGADQQGFGRYHGAASDHRPTGPSPAAHYGDHSFQANRLSMPTRRLTRFENLDGRGNDKEWSCCCAARVRQADGCPRVSHSEPEPNAVVVSRVAATVCGSDVHRADVAAAGSSRHLCAVNQEKGRP